MRAGVSVSILALLFFAACRRDMMNQPKAKTFSRSEFFKNGTNARALPANTVARGDVRTVCDEHLYEIELPGTVREPFPQQSVKAAASLEGNRVGREAFRRQAVLAGLGAGERAERAAVGHRQELRPAAERQHRKPPLLRPPQQLDLEVVAVPLAYYALRLAA